MSTEPKSASDFGTFRKRKLPEFLDENLILLGLTLIDKDEKGAPLGDKSYYSVKACIDNTGEMIEFLSSQTYLKPFYEKVIEAQAFPVNFRISKPGKSYEIGDWQ